MDLAAPLLTLTWLLLCSFQDIQQHRISNTLIFPALLLSLLHLIWHGSSLHGAPASHAMVAAFIALLLTLPGFLTGKMGAADIKMMLTLALLTAPTTTLWIFILAAVMMLLWSWTAKFTACLSSALVRHDALTLSRLRKEKLPYAPFVLTGSAVYFISALFW